MKIAVECVDDVGNLKIVVPTILDVQQKVNKELFYRDFCGCMKDWQITNQQSTLKGARQRIIDDYDFYLRYNGNFIAPTEMVFFCIPR